MDQFLYEYAALKINVIDEQDGLEDKKVQTGDGLETNKDGDYEEYEHIEGDTDEEVVDDDEDEDNEPIEKVKPECKVCLKEQFFGFNLRLKNH